MIDIDKINNSINSEKHTIDPFGTVYVKFITSHELDDLMTKSVAEQISFCILDENGERHFPEDKIKDIKEKMTIRHQDELINLIMKVNRFGISFDDDLKK
jgi:hypothetical protein